jgi:hypothetical protein
MAHVESRSGLLATKAVLDRAVANPGKTSPLPIGTTNEEGARF